MTEDPGRGPEFETLLSELSSQFINLAPGVVDEAIEQALGRVCGWLDIDLVVLWQWSEALPDHLMPTHVHSAVPDGPQPSGPMTPEQYPWHRQQILAGRPVAISSLSDLPPEAVVDRENAGAFGIRSNLYLPLSVGGGSPIGSLGFCALRQEREWPDRLVKRLQLVSQVFANALVRRHHELNLLQNMERLASGAELAGLGYYEVDFSTSAAYVDARFREICGMLPDSLSGLQPLQFWLEHLHRDDRERVLDLREQLHGGRLERLSIEYRFLHPALGERWISHLAGSAERNAAGRAVRTYGVLRDITTRRQAEESLRASYAEIQVLKDRLQAESDYLKAEISLNSDMGDVVGRSAAIRGVMHLVEQVASAGSSVLVLGETGTGKELVARAIHRQSPRRDRVMVTVNCAAMPAGLMESEMFGREKGAFTGALIRQPGRFEIADGSTIFLDEIGELPLELQAKLLRVLDTGEFQRLGSSRNTNVDVRVIAATNRDLVEEVRRGAFRQDLYYRLSVFPIKIPPLRERAEDIPVLVWTFLGEFCTRMGKRITHIPRKTMEALQRRPWPGNVRELRNVIEYGSIITTGDTLRVPALEDVEPVSESESMMEVERRHIVRTLERTGGRIKGPGGAAATLGLHPSTLYSRMKRLGIGQDPRTDHGGH